MLTVLFAIAMATSPHVAVAQQPSSPTTDTLRLTRVDAVARASLANPTVAIAAAQIRAARARRTQAGALPDPIGSATWEQGRGLFGAGEPTTRAVGVTLTLPFPEKLRLQRRAATADLQSSEADSLLQSQVIATLTSQAYDGLIAARHRLRDLTELAALADSFAAQARRRLDAGTAAQLDVVRADVDAGKARTDLLSARRDVQMAATSLNRLLDRPLDAPLVPTDSLTPPGTLPPLPALLAAAFAHRPELRSLTAQQDGAAATEKLARRFWLPDLTVGVGRDFADRGPGVLTTGIELPLPLFYWQHARGEIAESNARRHELEGVGRDLRAAIGEEVRLLYTTAVTANEQAAYLRDQVLPAAREAHRIASESYVLGGSAALDVLDARRTLLEAEQDTIEALLLAHTARADLERAVATPLVTLGTGAPHAR